MKTTITALAYLVFVALQASAQSVKPEYLKPPASWQIERFALPPAFAPAFPYKGVEELSFSPGMFNKDSADYFSYAFVARLDNVSSFTQTDVRNYLLIYFKGLCASTARQRKLSIDTSQIAVSINKGVHGPASYDAVLKIFGVFADGAPVTLNAEIKVLTDSKGPTTWLVFIASPQTKTNAIWTQLRDIQNAFSVN